MRFLSANTKLEIIMVIRVIELVVLWLVWRSVLLSSRAPLANRITERVCASIYEGKKGSNE